jgi:hypothetical protein
VVTRFVSLTTLPGRGSADLDLEEVHDLLGPNGEELPLRADTRPAPETVATGIHAIGAPVEVVPTLHPRTGNFPASDRSPGQ